MSEKISLLLRWKCWRKKAEARKWRFKMSYRCGGGGRGITEIIRPDVAVARRKYEACIDWLRENDPRFPNHSEE